VTVAQKARAVFAAVPRWFTVAVARRRRDRVALSYGHAHVPRFGEPVNGGMVKFQRLEEVWPNDVTGFNVLYLGSSSMPWDWRVLVRLARRRDAAIAWNQNGVAYPGWAGAATERINRPMAAVLHEADHVFFQSEFCRLASDTFLGRRAGRAEILYNAVDTDRFAPALAAPRPLTLLLGGSQYQPYRVVVALETVARLVTRGRDVRLVVTGALRWAPEKTARREIDLEIVRLGLDEHVTFTGTYTQQEAPDVLGSGDVLLHTQVNDASPGLVIEAMACGLPVAYAASGGVPELVGEEGGVGVPTPLDWERDHPPAPDALADAVEAIVEDLDEYRAAARSRAVARFGLADWVDRHRAVFEELAR
jgi:glycosyltransferase involved in cell wall biosynthesis